MSSYWSRIRALVGDSTIILPGAAGAIVRDGKILLVHHRNKNLWQIPGGLQEIGEKITETVCREIKEELGLSLEVKDVIGIYSGKEWTIESRGVKISILADSRR